MFGNNLLVHFIANWELNTPIKLAWIINLLIKLFKEYRLAHSYPPFKSLPSWNADTLGFSDKHFRASCAHFFLDSFL